MKHILVVMLLALASLAQVPQSSAEANDRPLAKMPLWMKVEWEKGLVRIAENSLPVLSRAPNILAEAAPMALPACPDLPPVCPGGLISQHATPALINHYMTKYGLTVPLSCRFQHPARCAINEVRVCRQQCTP